MTTATCAVSQSLELEARKLQYDDVVVGQGFDLLDDGVTDVPADEHAPPPRGEHAIDQRRRGGLSLGAGDADDRRGTQAKEERDLRQHGDARLKRAQDRRRPRAHTRDYEDEVGMGERDVVARWAEHEFHPVREVAQPRDPLAEVFPRLRVGDRHARLLADEEARKPGRCPAFSEPDDGHAAVPELVGADLGIEEHSHAERPRNASCVP